MGFQPHKVGDEPTGPFLGVVTKSDGGGMRANMIDLGALMLICSNPKEADRLIPVQLKDVTNRSIVFRCACGQPHCSRVLRYTVKAEGHHPMVRRAVATPAD